MTGSRSVGIGDDDGSVTKTYVDGCTVVVSVERSLVRLVSPGAGILLDLTGSDSNSDVLVIVIV